MIWAAHFLLSYITAAIWCAKVAGPDGSLGVVRVAIAMYTVLALSGIGVIGWSAFRRHSYGAAPPARRRHAGGSAPLPGVCHPAAVGPERGSDPVRGPRRRLHRELLLMRRALLVCGLLTLTAMWLGPLPQLARQAFWAHMTLHMGVVAVAAPLLALGVAGGRLDPVRHAPGLFAPIPASVLELVVVWACARGPAPCGAAWRGGLMAEQGMFLLAGLLVWLSAFGGDAWGRGNRAAAGVVGLLLTAMHMTLLGALLALTPRPLYAHRWLRRAHAS